MIKAQVSDNTADFMQRLDAAIGKGLEAAAAKLADGIAVTFGRNHGGVPSKPGQPPNTQFGGLRNSIGYTGARKEGKAWKAFAGSSLEYAAYLEKGAVIKPKNAKMLMIPLSHAMKLAIRRYGSPRAALASVGKIRWIKIDNRRSLVVRDAGKGKRGEALFLATKGPVVLAPRPWVRPAYNLMRRTMNDAFRDSVVASMSGGVA